MRVVEIGCGPGAAARAVADLLGPDGHVLAVDRSPRAIEQVHQTSADLLASGGLTTRCCDAEELHLEEGEPPYELAFAFRVGALDGRHPAAGRRALARLAHLLTPYGRLFIDRDDQLHELDVPRTYR